MYRNQAIGWRRFRIRRRPLITTLLLAICMALLMTGLGSMMPVLPKKLAAYGDGVQALGLSGMAFSIASLVAAPVMGHLADRFGRRPIVVGSLAAHVAAFIGYLLAPAAEMFIGVYALAGALTAGLAPATIGIIADISPEDERARWIGIFGGGSAVGLILGPPLGGQLYDRWGLSAPFIVSALISFTALLAAFTLIPETHTGPTRRRDALQKHRAAAQQAPSMWTAVQRPLSTFAALLFISFIAGFSCSFAAPQLPFYVYEEVGWTSSRFGLALSGYAVMLLLGQTLLGQLSDRFGRKPVVAAGLIMHSAASVALVLTGSFQLITLGAALSGLGEAMFSPALNAFLLDITPEQHRARVMGIKGSVDALGGLMGPALVMVINGIVPAQGIFIISASLLVFGAFLVPIVREPSQAGGTRHSTCLGCSMTSSVIAPLRHQGVHRKQHLNDTFRP